jgi:hypothetical protein
MAFVIDLMLRENATQVGHPRLGFAIGTFAFPALQFLLPHGHARGVATEIHDGCPLVAVRHSLMRADVLPALPALTP